MGDGLVEHSHTVEVIWAKDCRRGELELWDEPFTKRCRRPSLYKTLENELEGFWVLGFIISLYQDSGGGPSVFAIGHKK